MKFLFQNLWERKRAVAIVIVLLVVQALCELSLPNYTADIVDVGIQQNGVDSVAMREMSRDTYEWLMAFMNTDECAYVASCYEEGKDSYVLKRTIEVDKDKIKKLEQTLQEPLVLTYFMEYGAKQTTDSQYTSMMGDAAEGLVQVQKLKDAGVLQPTSLYEMRKKVSEQFGELGDTMTDQLSVAMVEKEYEALGYDMQKMQMQYLLHTGGVMILMTLGMLVAAVLLGFVSSKTAADIGRSLRQKVYTSVISYSGKEIDQFSTASLITRCTNDIQQVQMVEVMLLRLVLYAPVLAIGGIIMVSRTDTSMSWIIFIAVAVIIGVVLVLMKFSMPKFKMMQKLVDRLNLVSREILTGIPVIRAFSREEHEKERFQDANTALMETQLYTSRMMAWMMPIMMLIMNCITIAVVWFGAKGIAAGQMQVGDMMAFITYAMVIVMSFLLLTMMSIMLPRAGVAAERIQEVLCTKSSIEDAKTVADDTMGQIRGELAFHDVCFAYPNAKSNVLDHLDFVAEPGKTTAIIGSTGCGKSTLLQLIPRLYDVTEGSITLDGIDIRKISQKKLRDAIGYVPQKAVLFSGDIRSNIKYADDGISDDVMIKAAGIAQATEFVEEKEKKYESHISQGGSNVSGGQKQRLAIARAIAKEPKIYLFDDSFSALDFKTDKALREALFMHAKDATILIVAQRISTILHADQILVLDDGKIVGKGTHQELLKTCQTYQEIAMSQLSQSEIEKTKGGMV
ncbi:MAG: ABC transporter ATP-binding protein [Lachnospiraceae bacterium]|nr:ABC transporter ATP-binding protein [Lachnospiraceae bacterium]